MSRSEIKDWIVMSLAFGTILLLFFITLGDFYVAMENSREGSKDVINLLSMSITGIVGIIAGFISGKNAADQAKQQAEAQGQMVEEEPIPMLHNCVIKRTCRG